MANVADLVLLAGQMLLENGGETYRVEETMVHMAFACGAESIDVFAIPSGIFFTLNKGQETFTRVARVHRRGFNLAKVVEVNRISRELSEKLLTNEEAYVQLLKTNSLPRRYTIWVHTFAGAIASATFTYLLGAHMGSIFVAGLAGFIVMNVMDFLQEREIFQFVAVAIGGLVAALVNLAAATLFPRLELNLSIVGSLMLLVPGVAITTSMRDALTEDFVAASVRGFEAFGVALSIATGVGTVLALYLWLGGKLP